IGLALNVLFVVTLVQTGWAPPHTGIAAATSCSALCNAALLLRGLKRAGVYRPRGGWTRLAAQVLGAAAVMTAVLVLGVAQVGDWLALARLERAAALAAAVAGAALVYFAATWAFGLRVVHLRAGGGDNWDGTHDAGRNGPA